jgi:hypothetical protein
MVIDALGYLLDENLKAELSRLYMAEIAGLIKAAILENKCERSHEFFVLGGWLPGKVYMGARSTR